MDPIASLPGPLSRLLSAGIVQNLTGILNENSPDQHLRQASENAKILAREILQAPVPLVPAAPAPAPPVPSASDVELEEAQEELRVAVAERDAARNAAAAIQQQLQTVTTQLNNALAMGAAQANGSPGEGNGSGGHPDVPTFDGAPPHDIRTWILLLRNKLAAQPSRYSTEQAKLRYAFSRLAGAAFNQVRSHLSEDTGAIDLGTLNELLSILRQAYDGPDRARTARNQLKTLEQKHLHFSVYLAEFRRLMGDLDWDDQAQRDQLEDGLSEDMKDALEWRPRATTLAQLIELCMEFDSLFRARAQEKKGKAPASPAASSSAAAVAHPTDSNSGNYDIDSNLEHAAVPSKRLSKRERQRRKKKVEPPREAEARESTTKGGRLGGTGTLTSGRAFRYWHY
jgi:hypothetical protein